MQDHLVQEMLYREQRKEIHKHVFLGQLLAAGLLVPNPLFEAWVDMLSDEITQDNYNPQVLAVKRRVQALLQQKDSKELGLVKRVQDFEITDHTMLQPMSKEALEKVRETLRKRTRAAAEKKNKEM